MTPRRPEGRSLPGGLRERPRSRPAGCPVSSFLAGTKFSASQPPPPLDPCPFHNSFFFSLLVTGLCPITYPDRQKRVAGCEWKEKGSHWGGGGAGGGRLEVGLTLAEDENLDSSRLVFVDHDMVNDVFACARVCMCYTLPSARLGPLSSEEDERADGTIRFLLYVPDGMGGLRVRDQSQHEAGGQGGT